MNLNYTQDLISNPLKLFDHLYDSSKDLNSLNLKLKTILENDPEFIHKVFSLQMTFVTIC